MFAAIVLQQAGRALSALAIDNLAGQRLRDTLPAFGQRLIKIYMSPALLGFYRNAITECTHFPDLVHRFYDLGPGRAGATHAEALVAAPERGEIRTGDGAMAANHFVGMIRGNLHLQVMLGLREPPDTAVREALVTSVVAIFLDDVGYRSAPSGR